MTLRIRFRNKDVGSELRHGLQIAQERISETVRRTMRDVSETIEREGRRDIAAAGNFGTRWTQGLHAEERFSPNQSRVVVFHDIPFFSVFEDGKVIRGKPMLWIPLSFADDAQGKRARDYPGGLFRVDRKSGAAPLLLSVRTGEPKYFGKKSVTIPKKFHIGQIIRDTSRKMRQFYSKHFRQLVGRR